MPYKDKDGNIVNASNRKMNNVVQKEVKQEKPKRKIFFLIRGIIKKTMISFKNWLSRSIRIEYLLTPFSVERMFDVQEGWTCEIFIFGIRIFIFRRL